MRESKSPGFFFIIFEHSISSYAFFTDNIIFQGIEIIASFAWVGYVIAIPLKFSPNTAGNVIFCQVAPFSTSHVLNYIYFWHC